MSCEKKFNLQSALKKMKNKSSSTTKSSPTPKKKKEKIICPCAVSITTKKRARDDVEKGVHVYFKNVDNGNGKIKTYFYRSCAKPTFLDKKTGEQFDYCYKHKDSEILLFKDDILDKVEDGEYELATIDCDELGDTFSKKNPQKIVSMKSNINTRLSFKKNEEFLEKFKGAYQKMLDLASGKNLLDSSSDEEEEEEEEADKVTEEVHSDAEEEHSDAEETIKVDISKDDDVLSTIEVEEDEEEEVEGSGGSGEESGEEEEVEEPSVEAEGITSKDGTEYYVDPDDKSILSDDGDIIGYLMEVDKEYFQIFYEDKYWTIIDKFEYKGTDLFRCIITNNVFRFSKKSKDKLSFFTTCDIKNGKVKLHKKK